MNSTNSTPQRRHSSRCKSHPIFQLGFVREKAENQARLESPAVCLKTPCIYTVTFKCSKLAQQYAARKHTSHSFGGVSGCCCSAAAVVWGACVYGCIQGCYHGDRVQLPLNRDSISRWWSAMSSISVPG